MQLNIFAVLRSKLFSREKPYISFEEQIIPFERVETSHDKVASPKQRSNEASIYIVHINLHKLSSCVFFADNFRQCTILNAVYEEIFKLHNLEVRYLTQVTESLTSSFKNC